MQNNTTREMDFPEAWATYLEWITSGRGSEGVPHLQEALDVLEDSYEEMEENGYYYI